MTVVDAVNTAMRDSIVEEAGEGLIAGVVVTGGGCGPPRPWAFGTGTCSHSASKYWGGRGFSSGETLPLVASWQGN